MLLLRWPTGSLEPRLGPLAPAPHRARQQSARKKARRRRQWQCACAADTCRRARPERSARSATRRPHPAVRRRPSRADAADSSPAAATRAAAAAASPDVAALCLSGVVLRLGREPPPCAGALFCPLTIRERNGNLYLTSKDAKQLDKREGGELHLNKQPNLGR